MYEHPRAIAPRDDLAKMHFAQANASEFDWMGLDRPDGSEPEVGAFGVIATKGSWVSKAIAWSTRSMYNHAFLYIGHGQLVEGWWPETRIVSAAVWHSSATPTPEGEPRRVLWSDYDGMLRLSKTQQEMIADYAVAEVGKRYNLIQYVDFIGALFGKDFKVSDTSGLKVCSTLVAFAWARAHTGLVLQADKEEREQGLRKPWEPFLHWNEVSPAMLARTLGETRLWLPKH